MCNDTNDIVTPVGSSIGGINFGTISWTTVIPLIPTGLLTLSTFLLTLTHNLPAGISPTVGVVLTAVAGGLSAVYTAILAASHVAVTKAALAARVSDKIRV